MASNSGGGSNANDAIAQAEALAAAIVAGYAGIGRQGADLRVAAAIRLTERLRDAGLLSVADQATVSDLVRRAMAGLNSGKQLQDVLRTGGRGAVATVPLQGGQTGYVITAVVTVKAGAGPVQRIPMTLEVAQLPQSAAELAALAQEGVDEGETDSPVALDVKYSVTNVAIISVRGG